jgi:N-acetyl-gamma-glutamylphosphate reductase
MPRLVYDEPFEFNEFENQTLFIEGAGGKLGRDLGRVSTACGLQVVSTAEEANFVALCTPSHVAAQLLDKTTYGAIYKDSTIIDLSGAAKHRRFRPGVYEYGLMRTETKPWNENFNADAKIYGNPGCIASAVILGLGAAGLKDERLPQELSVFSVGGRSHTSSVEDNDIALARRLMSHPHVTEIETAYQRRLKVVSFMPTICDVPDGLMVSMHGRVHATKEQLQEGMREPYEESKSLSVRDVVGTHLLKHKLQYHHGVLDTQDHTVDFSLGVVIDNVRFVTTNVIHLMRHLRSQRLRTTQTL